MPSIYSLSSQVGILIRNARKEAHVHHLVYCFILPIIRETNHDIWYVQGIHCRPCLISCVLPRSHVGYLLGEALLREEKTFSITCVLKLLLDRFLRLLPVHVAAQYVTSYFTGAGQCPAWGTSRISTVHSHPTNLRWFHSCGRQHRPHLYRFYCTYCVYARRRNISIQELGGCFAHVLLHHPSLVRSYRLSSMGCYHSCGLCWILRSAKNWAFGDSCSGGSLVRDPILSVPIQELSWVSNGVVHPNSANERERRRVGGGAGKEYVRLRFGPCVDWHI